ncbi:hypothetical protein B0T18DRAFT_436690 [Schizothecium vesticola]|uniref:Uncharacterized protein n=1 Tax=Schizothecium vesticola TaxID=314040 RepID=A0AA40F0P2_9PEZI|nr:hypothetical protein B0T18DRAFT_436690 [Schizothecium vesticola]
MQLSIATLFLAAVGFVSAAPKDASVIMARQNQGRPVPNGQCCVANTSVKQDICTASNGQQGRCVPGGNNCGAALSCVADSNLTCNNVSERNRNLCRANAGNGGLFDGANIIQNLGQASVN